MGLSGFILCPFTLLYSLITRFRNHLYDIGYKRSFQFQTRVICVGNLSVGGTGKTPMIEYLISLLKSSYKIVTLSRGYKRKTKGFRLVTDRDNPNTVGDEPWQFYQKFSPDVGVAVGEERALAIPRILFEKEGTDLILLDDGFQHRTVRSNLNILVTEFNNPFFTDHPLPSGRLREPRLGANRANMIVVTKSPLDLDEKSMEDYTVKINKYYSGNNIYFSGIKYLDPQPIFGSGKEVSQNILAFSGLGNPKHFESYLDQQYNLIDSMRFQDHHQYSYKTIEIIKKRFNAIDGVDKCLITTEKDMVKLKNFEKDLSGLPLFYIPIEFYFLKDGKGFDNKVKKMLHSISIDSNSINESDL